MHDVVAESTLEQAAEVRVDDAQLAGFRAMAARLCTEQSEARFEATLRKLLEHTSERDAIAASGFKLPEADAGETVEPIRRKA